MKKRAYMINMTYNVNSEEKEIGKKIIIFLSQTSKKLDACSDYLNLLKTPFKDNPISDPEELFKTREPLRTFRDQALSNYKEFKNSAFHCIEEMNYFSNDTQTSKLLKSFINAVEDLSLLFDQFKKLFDDLKDKDFTKNILKNMTVIQEQCDGLSEMIQDRIKNHFQNNIIGNNWMDSVGDELGIKIEKRKPALLDILNNTNNNVKSAYTISERKALLKKLSDINSNK